MRSGDEERCIPGPGYRDPNGYTRVRVNGKAQYAHRAAYEAVNGPIPAGLVIDHLCRVRDCINPSHMEAVPQGVNVRRGESLWAKNAAKTECSNGHAFDAENTYRRPDGDRDCRTCKRDADRRSKARLRG